MTLLYLIVGTVLFRKGDQKLVNRPAIKRQNVFLFNILFNKNISNKTRVIVKVCRFINKITSGPLRLDFEHSSD